MARVIWDFGSIHAGAWEDGYLRIHDVATGERVREMVTPAGYLNDAKYSPSGEFILIGEGWP